MPNRRWIHWWKLLKWIVPLFLAVCTLTAIYAATAAGQVSDQEVLLLGPDQLAPGTQASLRAIVRDHRTGEPIAGANIRLLMRPKVGGPAQTLFQGRTDPTGSVPIQFAVPTDAAEEQVLVLEARSGKGGDRLERPVRLRRDYKLLLTTDKPLYQPGQTVHVRALALSTLDLQPAKGQAIQLTIEDPKGNKVFRQSRAASDFGVASWEFRLANEVNTGPYKLTAALGETTSEKTVTVKPYVLPKFQVRVETDKTYYQPGQEVRGTVAADYFFGKPVAGGQVRLKGFIYAVERQQVMDLQGATDESGRFEFAFNLPEYFVGGMLEEGLATFGLEVTVVDQADHAEVVAQAIPVARDPILIHAVPEAGRLKPGVENVVYLLTSYPDGAPAQTTLEVEVAGESRRLETGPYGLAELTLTPPADQPSLTLAVTAQDLRGNRASWQVELGAEWAPETVLLRTDKAAYRVGETMHVTALTTRPGTVYLDIVKAGQVMSTRAMNATAGTAEAAIDLDQTLLGTLELHAYKVLRDGTIVRDTRLALVGGAEEVQVQITSDKDVYRPGEPATIRFVTTVAGRPVPTAIGVTAVDESVFALQEQEAGFAKLFFLLQAELMEPRYDIHGLRWDQLMSPEPGQPEAALRAQETTAKAALAQAPGADLRPVINSYVEKAQAATARQAGLFRTLASRITEALIVLPFLVGAVVLVSLGRRRILLASLGLSVLLAALGALIVLALASVRWVPPWIEGLGPAQQVFWALREAMAAGAPAVLVLALPLLGLIGFVALIVYALRRRDEGLQFALIVLVTWILLWPLLGYAAARAQPDLGQTRLILLLAGFLALPLAFLLRGAGFGAQRQIAPALSALALSLGVFAALPVAVIGLAATGAVPLGAMAPAPREFRRGDVMQEVVKVVEKAVQAMPAAAPTPAPAPGIGGAGAAQEPPRLRQFFPETLYVNPEVLTDDQGVAEITVPMADSITTWRLTALASSQKGELGSAVAGLRVFQDFFVDLDLPVALTQGDEVAVPVAVFNYLTEAQSVRLELTPEDWFELLGPPSQVLQIEPNDVEVVYFRIRAAQFGTHRLTITAWGQRMSDAIAREVRVLPDGKALRQTVSDRLEGTIERTVTIPEPAITGTARIWVKVYPGVVSQVVEGLEGLLRMPMGCFEQTSSLTYPNVLVLDYLKTTNQIAPEVQLKAEEYIALGYQRLLTFEVPGGGFSLFGEAPANVVLSSYGLMEFSDMAKVWEVDPALIERTARWIIERQKPDGSWADDAGFVHEDTWQGLANKQLPITAYVVWALSDSGFEDDSATARGLDYLRAHWHEADDPYVLALVANALVAHDPKDPVARAALEKLDALKTVDKDQVYWEIKTGSFMGSHGSSGNLETTALAAYVFLRAQAFPQTAQGGAELPHRQQGQLRLLAFDPGNHPGAQGVAPGRHPGSRRGAGREGASLSERRGGGPDPHHS